jgi:SNF family Na+-dependent transporter
MKYFKGEKIYGRQTRFLGKQFRVLMAAIGSAVGLGNIWGFPYKMGKGGGFAFLLIYILCVIFIGFWCNAR